MIARPIAAQFADDGLIALLNSHSRTVSFGSGVRNTMNSSADDFATDLQSTD